MQTIFSRIEFPIGDRPTEEIFDEFRHFAVLKNELVVGGAGVAVRTSAPRAAIILTYDQETDTLFRLKYLGKKGVIFTDMRKKNG